MENKIFELLLGYIDQCGYYSLFLLTFLEAAAFLGLFIPGETMVVVAGLAASKGFLDIGDVIWVAALGAILGDTVGYFLGTHFGEGIFTRYGKYLFLKKERLCHANRLFERHGGKTVFFGRFVSLLRTFAPIIAGMSKMFYPKFLFYNVTGGVVWALSFSLLGYFVGNSWDVIKTYITYFITGSIISLTVGAAVYYIYSFINKNMALVIEKANKLDTALNFHMPKAWGFVKSRFSAE